MTSDPLPDFSSLLRTALGSLLNPHAQTFVEMFAENGVLEFPFAPPGGVQRLKGRQALVEYLPQLAAAVDIKSFTAPTVHHTMKPGVVIVEFGSEARSRQSGLDFHQRYISVITVRDGSIVHYADYWNPIIALQAMGGEKAVLAAFRQEEEVQGAQR